MCISLNWFSGLGVPNALVLATVLVKLLRIYHIFSQSTPKKLSKKCSDSYLAVYVMLILLPLVVVHTIWTNVDPYLGLLKVTSELDIVEYEKQCASKYMMLWYVVLALYILIMFAMLFGVAIKMRNIKVSHFNDTKKVTVLVVCYFVDLIVALTCWRILYTKVNAYVAAIVLHSYCTMPAASLRTESFPTATSTRERPWQETFGGLLRNDRCMRVHVL